MAKLKLAWFLIGALFWPALGFGQPCTQAPSGLLGWWGGNHTALDAAGQHDGELYGDATYTTGVVGEAFLFDGSGDAILLGNPAAFALQDFTIETWLRRTSTTAASHDFAGGSIFGYGQGGYALGMQDDGTLYLTRMGIDNTSTQGSIQDTNWHHVAVTKSGSQVVFYVDGTAYSAPDYDPGFTFGGPVAIGARADSRGNSFLGAIDEVSLYDHALSATEIQAIFDAGSGGKCASPPTITTQPTDQITAVTFGASFGVVASGTVPLHYQWRFNGSDLAGATSMVAVVAFAAFTDAGGYSVVITNSSGSVTSTVATLTVTAAPPCTSPPGDLTGWWRGEANGLDSVGTNHGSLVGQAGFGPGEAGRAFSFAANGSAVLLGNRPSLQRQTFTIETWFRRTDTTIVTPSGADCSFFGYGAGGYALGLTRNGEPYLGRIGTSAVILSNAVVDTDFHHLAVTKSGTTVIFYLDGTAFPAMNYATTFTFGTSPAIGARGDTLQATFIGLIDEVSFYERPLAAVEIQAVYAAGNGGKCALPTAPSVTIQPANLSVSAGTNAAFTVGAAGTSPLSYQWRFQSANVPGATNYALNLTNIQAAAVGNYQVVITNASGSVTSEVATLVLRSPPVINNQPQDTLIAPGATAFFLVGFSGSAPLAFQWRLNGADISGAQNYSLSITNAQAVNAGSYTVVITNVFGSVTSAPAALALTLPPTIINQPTNVAVAVGGNATFSVVAVGAGPLRYQWRFGAATLPGATNTSLTLTNVQPGQAGTYSVVVSNQYGALPSSNALLAVTTPLCAPIPDGLVAWWQGEGSAVEVVSGVAGVLLGNAGYAAGKVGTTFNLDGSGDLVTIGNPTNLQLQNFTIETWIRRASGTVASFSSGGGEIFGYGAGGYCLGMFNDGRLYLTKINVDAVVLPNAITDTNFHHIAVTKAGTNVVFYIDGAPSNMPPYSTTYTFATAPAIGGRADTLANSFYGAIDEVAVFNRALNAAEIQSIYSSSVSGKCAYPPLAWGLQPTNQTGTIGANAAFSALPSGSRPIRYQWFFNGFGLDGATNATLSLTNLTFFQAGAYSVTAANPAGSLNSSNATLVLQSAPLQPNLSFELGTLAGWIVTDLAEPLTPVGVHGAGYNSGYGFFDAAPTDGAFCLTHGFDGNGPGRIRVAMDVTLPPSPASLTFSWRAGWDLTNFGPATKPRTFGVTFEPFGGGVGLRTNTVLTAAPGTVNYDTGPQLASIDLAAYAGRAIRISFDATIPEAFTGPGFLQLDNVVFSFAPVPPLILGRSGANVVLSWPAMFSNYVVWAATNLSPPVNWTVQSTNAVVAGATNTTLTLPIGSGARFYRLRSP